MKKVLFAAVAVLALASCKKEYTCECTTSLTGSATTSGKTEKLSKKDAKAACEKNNSSVINCQIK